MKTANPVIDSIVETQTNFINNWMDSAKKMQSALSNGSVANEGQSIYKEWLEKQTAILTSMKDSSANAFTNANENNPQEFFQPMVDALQKGQFNADAFKNHFTADSYSNLTKQLFGNLYNGASIKDVYDNGIKQVQSFFSNQNNLGKEYYAQVQNISKEYPQLFTGNIDKVKELYSQVNDVFGKTFEPLLKIVSPGKEKESVEATIALMDKLAEYSIKQSELQAILQATTQKSVEKIATEYAEKFKNPEALKQLPNAQEMYNDWVKVNEQLFTELFASSEFSKIKGDALNLSMDVKKHFEKQFEQTFENFPIVFKTEVEELHKTVYDLKKQVKDLLTKVAANIIPDADEDKTAKTRKK